MEARIRVRVTPRSSRNEIAGWQDGCLRVRVTPPPVDGQANEALERLLARVLGVPKVAVAVVSGAHSREKTVVIDGLSQEDALERLRQIALP